MGIVIYDVTRPLKIPIVQQRLRDLLTIISVVSPQVEAFQWLSSSWFEIHEAVKHPISLTDMEAAVNGLVISEIPPPNVLQQVVDFERCRPFSIVETKNHFSLRIAIASYFNLHADDSLRHQLETLAFARCAPGFLSTIFPNENLAPSLLWTLLDSLMPKGSSTQIVSCPKCGELIATKIPLPTSQRIEAFVAGLDLRDADRELIKEFLPRLNRNIRNPFYHAARKPDHDHAEQFLKKLGQGIFSSLDEIKHNNGRWTGVHLLNAILADELMTRLGAVASPS